MGLPEPNFAAVERAIRDLLIAIGENPDRDGLKKTPYRIAKMYSDVFDANFTECPMPTTFEQEEYDGIVMVHHVPFYAFCEHHLALFHGDFGIAYVPNKHIIGLSKLIRIFRWGTKKPTIQERITELAVNKVIELCKPRGAICYVSAEHSCMTLRGVKSPGAITTTISHRGCFSNDREMREHFVELASS